MTLAEIPPAFILLIGAALLPLFPRKFRPGLVVVFPLAALIGIAFLDAGTTVAHRLGSFDLILLQVDSLNRGFGLIFAFAGLAGGVYAMHMRELREQVAALCYVGGSLGVTFAGDFFTLLLFWEVMTVASVFLIWAGGTRAAEAAGFRYLMVHLIGGSLLLAGLVLLWRETGSLELSPFAAGTESLAPWLILGGVLVNTGAPPLHAWAPDSYPKSTVTGAVFLNAFTTKTAVYVLVQCFPGWPLVFWMGLLMAFYAVYYAVLANDIRLILAYHLISQVGYMLVAIGIGGEMGVSAAAAHAYNNILYKMLLFMGTGAVLHAVGTTRLVDLGGLGRRMKGVVALYLVGAFSISGFPLFNGFVSKSMILHEVGKYEAYLLLLVGVGTFLSVGLKLTYFTWFHRERGDLRVRKIPGNMYGGMFLLAVPCILFGVWPGTLFRLLPHAVDFHPFTIYGVVEAIQLPLFTFVVFWIFRRKFAPDAKVALDLDWFYRKPAPMVRRICIDGVNAVFAGAQERVVKLTGDVARFARNPAAFRLRPDSDFDPERQRLPLGSALGATLLTFVAIAAAVLFRGAGG